MPLPKRCALATVLGKEIRDFLEWIDLSHVQGVLGNEGFNLLVIPAGPGELRSVFKRGERCAFSLERRYRAPGKIQVQVAEDPPPLLPEGRAYAILVATEISRGRRWQFEWPLNMVGYRGCEVSPSEAVQIDFCRRGDFSFGVPHPTFRITVVQRSWGFDAESAHLAFDMFSAPFREPR